MSKCKRCGSAEAIPTALQNEEPHSRIAIEINPEVRRKILGQGVFEGALGTDEYSVSYALTPPKKSWADHAALAYVALLIIVLWGFGQSAVFGIVLTIGAFYCVGVMRGKEDPADKKLEVETSEYMEQMGNYKPIPPPEPKNRSWQFWVWACFGVVAPVYFNDKGEYVGYLVPFLSLVLFPLAWPGYKKRFALIHKIEMQAYTQVMSHWSELEMCTSCGLLSLKDTPKQ